MNRRRIRLALLVLAPVCAVTLVLLYFFLQSRKPKPLEHWVSEIRIGVKVLHEPGGKFRVVLGNLSDQEVASLVISSNVITTSSAEAAMMSLRKPSGRQDTMYMATQGTLDDDPASHAIQNLGPRALPYLRAGIRPESGAAAFWRVRMLPRLPAAVQKVLEPRMHPFHKRVSCAYALGLLGPAARPAIPELQALVKNDPAQLVRSVAFEALHRIDPEAAGPFYPELFKPCAVSPSQAQGTNTLFRTELSL